MMQTLKHPSDKTETKQAEELFFSNSKKLRSLGLAHSQTLDQGTEFSGEREDGCNQVETRRGENFEKCKSSEKTQSGKGAGNSKLSTWLSKATLLRSVWIVSFIASALLTFCITGTSSSFPFVFATFFVIALLCGGSIKFADTQIRIHDKKRQTDDSALWYGKSGLAVMFLAVCIPAMISIASFPLEDGSKIISIMSLCSFLGNLLGWQEIRKGAASSPLMRRFFFELSIIWQLTLFGIASVHNNGDNCWLTVFQAYSFALLAILGWMYHQLRRNVDVPKREKNLATFAATLATIVWMSPFFPQLLTATSIFAAASDIPYLKEFGSGLLEHNGDAQEALKNRITSASNALYDQLLVPRSVCNKVYYKVTGEAQHFTGADPYYAAPIVGRTLPGLMITDSTLSVRINKAVPTARLAWVLQFKNTKSEIGQEAKVVFSIPHGAVVSALRVLPIQTQNNSQSPNASQAHSLIENAKFGALEKLQPLYTETALSLRDPAIVTPFGVDAVMLRCAPLLEGKPLRVELQIDNLIKRSSNSDTTAILELPQIKQSNIEKFCMPRIIASSSAGALGAPITWQKTHGVALTPDEPKEVSAGQRVPAAQAKQISITNHPTVGKSFFQLKGAHGKNYSFRRSSTPAISNRNLIIAIDASTDNAYAKGAILKALSTAPSSVSRVVLADPLRGLRTFDSASATEALRTMPFRGGDDNWSLLAESITQAKKHEANVLWIHGPKYWRNDHGSESWQTEYQNGAISVPFNLSDLCGGKVKIFDLPTTANGENEIIERILAASQDTTCFVHIERSANLKSDLDNYISNWNRAVKNYDKTPTFEMIPTENPANAAKCQSKSANELFTLAAKTTLDRMIFANRSGGKNKPSIEEIQKFSTDNKVISPFTAALARPASEQSQSPQIANGPPSGIQEKSQAQAQQDEAAQRDTDSDAFASAPGHTTRVNNLAALENLLYTLCTAIEIVFLAYGLPQLVIGLLRVRGCGVLRIFVGLFFISTGLAIPALINWLIASSVDTGGFS